MSSHCAGGGEGLGGVGDVNGGEGGGSGGGEGLVGGADGDKGEGEGGAGAGGLGGGAAGSVLGRCGQVTHVSPLFDSSLRTSQRGPPASHCSVVLLHAHCIQTTGFVAGIVAGLALLSGCSV